MFRTRETRPGPGALSTPGTAVPARPRVRPVTAACRLAAAGPCHPGATTRPGDVSLTRHQQGFTGVRPSRPSPRLWSPDGTGTLGLYPGLHTRLSRTQPRMPGRGRASGTGPESRHRHQRPPSTHSLTTSDLMSQRTTRCPLEPGPGSFATPIIPGQRAPFRVDTPESELNDRWIEAKAG